MLDRLFNRIGHLIVKKSKPILISIAILTIFFAFGITKIDMKMGNDVFVSSNSDAYKNTTTYQKNFGGDGVYLLISGDRDKLISHEMTKKLVSFNEKATKIDNITGTLNYVTLMNEMFQSGNVSSMNGSASEENNHLMQEMMMNELDPKDVKRIEKTMEDSLTPKQEEQIGTFTQKQLTTSQMQKLGAKMAALGTQPTANQQQRMIQSILTQKQKDAIKDYTTTILTNAQKDKIQKAVLSSFPPIQNLSTKALKAIVFSDNGKVPKELEQLIPSNGKHLVVSLNTSDDTEMSAYVRMTDDIKALIKDSDFPAGVSVKIAGSPMIMGGIQSEAMTTMAIMLSLSVVLMIIVLAIVFPVRRRLLSLGYVLVGLIWTFGFMGWTGIPITLATMATLPIIIGLGTDFGVQFHNRYEEEFRLSQFNAAEAVHKSIKHIGPAVGIAVFIMALSFLTMFLSKAPMIQQFGLTLAIGVVICYTVELFLMFATFNLVDQKKKNIQVKEEKTIWLSKFLSQYAELVGRFAIPILIVGISLSAMGFANEHKLKIETSMLKMIPQEMESVKNTNQLTDIVGSTTYITFLVEADDVTDSKVITWMDNFGTEITKEYKSIEGVTSLPAVLNKMGDVDYSDQSTIDKNIKYLPPSLSSTVLSSNHKYATLQFQVDSDLSSQSQLNVLKKITKEINAPSNIKVNPAGAQVMSLYGVENIAANNKLMMVAGLAIIFFGLLLVYRRVKHALYPLVPIALVLGFSPGTLLLLNMSYNPLTIALSCLVLGIGTEFTILIMERFREEEAKGLNAKEAIKVSLSKVGQAITASGLTVILGFSTLMFVSFPVLKDFGVTTVIDTLLT
ncbi:efflux RND transporter permease subunit [Rummeliibacillus suwonensis]|uniref:efflux RND transporter permease subunit n=1 Tax=Rummeliibacillus suwonensis TaxID=1306154 RepID=UPI00289B6F5F|nr:hydrophobe/amphiphile efflux-3 (HAE3) family transporter [Rummeliibacillus suwonensis]